MGATVALWLAHFVKLPLTQGRPSLHRLRGNVLRDINEDSRRGIDHITHRVQISRL